MVETVAVPGVKEMRTINLTSPSRLDLDSNLNDLNKHKSAKFTSKGAGPSNQYVKTQKKRIEMIRDD